jgi:hypothetical protein
MRIKLVRRLTADHRGLVGFAVGVVTVGTLAGGGVALAAIPSSSTGQYTACVLKKTGAVRIIDYQSDKRCTGKEKTIQWSKGWRYRGTWSATAAYAVGDLAVQSGSSYLAKTRSTGLAPEANPSNWGLLAKAGTPGAQGPTGPAGPAGPAGSAGPVALHYVSSGPFSVEAGQQDGADATCPPGTSVTGGGVYNGSTDTRVSVNTSYPFDGDDSDNVLDDGWSADLNNGSEASVMFAVWAVCTSATVSMP